MMVEDEPEVHEVVQLFQSILQETMGRMKEDQETRKLTRQWSKKRTVSHTMMTFKSRVRIYPFNSDIKTVSEDVEQTFVAPRRVWSMPEFKTLKEL